MILVLLLATQLSGSQIAGIPRTNSSTALSFDQTVKLARSQQFNQNVTLNDADIVPYLVYAPEWIWGLLSDPVVVRRPPPPPVSQ